MEAKGRPAVRSLESGQHIRSGKNWSSQKQFHPHLHTSRTRPQSRGDDVASVQMDWSLCSLTVPSGQTSLFISPAKAKIPFSSSHSHPLGEHTWMTNSTTTACTVSRITDSLVSRPSSKGTHFQTLHNRQNSFFPGAEPPPHLHDFARSQASFESDCSDDADDRNFASRATSSCASMPTTAFKSRPTTAGRAIVSEMSWVLSDDPRRFSDSEGQDDPSRPSTASLGARCLTSVVLGPTFFSSFPFLSSVGNENPLPPHLSTLSLSLLKRF